MIFNSRHCSLLLVIALVLGALYYTGAIQAESSFLYAVSDVSLLDGELDDELDMLEPAGCQFIKFSTGSTTQAVFRKSDHAFLSHLPEPRAPPCRV